LTITTCGVATGKTSIKGNVDNVFGLLVDRAILKISLYNGEGDPVPTVRDYEDIGINSVGEKNIKIKNLRIAAEKDQTKKDSKEEIRVIISSQSKASFKINLIAVASVAEKDAFTSPTPTLTGAPRVGVVTWAIGGKDASMFTISATTGVISMSKRDYENPLDEDINNVYEVTIIATDSDKNTASKDLKVTVTDVHEFVSGEYSFDGVTYKTVGQRPPPAAPQDFSLSSPVESALVQSEFSIINGPLLAPVFLRLVNCVGDVPEFLFSC
jgi:hypothetical protein